MPYPNEHAARIQNPDKYTEFKRVDNEFGDGIHVIYGQTESGLELQSIRFDAKKFTANEAKKWLDEHDYIVIEFEPATEAEAKIILRGEVGMEINLTETIGLIKALGEFEKLTVEITSIGGCSETGRKIYDYLKSLGKPITTKAIDYCYSAAFTIFLAGENRIAEYNNTEFLMHSPWMADFFLGGDNEAKELYDLIRAEKEKLINLYSSVLGMNIEETETLMDNDEVISAKAALGHKIVTEIENNTNKETNNNELFFYGLFDKIAAAARVNQNQKELQTKIKNKMEAEKITKELNEQKTLLQKIVAMFKNSIKALSIATEEGTTLEVEGDELVEGATVTNDAHDGTYILTYAEKKWTVVIEGGIVKTITEIVDEPTDDVEALKQENADLKAEIEKLKADLQAKADIEAKLKELESFVTLAKKVMTPFEQPDGTYKFEAKSLTPEPKKTTKDIVEEWKEKRYAKK